MGARPYGHRGRGPRPTSDGVPFRSPTWWAGSGPVGSQAAQGRQRGWGLPSGRQRGQELRRRLLHLAHRSLDGLFGSRRGRLDPADLPDVLAGGRLDLLGGGHRLEATKGCDVATHAVEVTGIGLGPATARQGVPHVGSPFLPLLRFEVLAGRADVTTPASPLGRRYRCAMPRLLVVHHTPSPAMHTMFLEAVAGANDPAIDGVDVVVRPALAATVGDVLEADGFLLGTPVNLGYISGALKYFFDQVYYPCLEATAGRPFGAYLHGDNDATGAVRAIDVITTGLAWRRAQEYVIVTGPVDRVALADCRELGAALAAGLSLGP